MKRRIAAAFLLISGGSFDPLSACGDKFVGALRGTRLQQAPRGRQEAVLVYANPSSDVPAALARVSVDLALRGAGYRPRIVATAAEFERELVQGGWDLVVLGLSDAQAVTEHGSSKFGMLPVALKTSSAELNQTRKIYPVVLTKSLNNDAFVRAVDDALTFWSKTRKPSRAG